MLEAGTKAALLEAARWKLWPLTEAPPRPYPQGRESRDSGDSEREMTIMEMIMRGMRMFKKMVVIIILFCLVIKSGAKIIWEKG